MSTTRSQRIQILFIPRKHCTRAASRTFGAESTNFSILQWRATPSWVSEIVRNLEHLERNCRNAAWTIGAGICFSSSPGSDRKLSDKAKEAKSKSDGIVILSPVCPGSVEMGSGREWSGPDRDRECRKGDPKASYLLGEISIRCLNRGAAESIYGAILYTATQQNLKFTK
eukprot:447965_1